jgi:myosin heavy subunit
MVPTMLKRVVVCGVLTTWMLVMPGCGVKQSEYDAKVAEVQNQAEKSARAEKKTLQLQKELDSAKGEIEKANQAKKEAEAKLQTVEQDNTDLKDRITKSQKANVAWLSQVRSLKKANTDLQGQVRTLRQANIDLKTKAEEKTSQLPEDRGTAKSVAEQAKKDADSKNQARKGSGPLENLSGAWEITLKNRVLRARLEALVNNRYRLKPESLAFSGVYEFDGNTLSMVAENPAYPDLVWSMKGPGLFEITAGTYAGAAMKKKVVGGTDEGHSQPKPPTERE